MAPKEGALKIGQLVADRYQVQEFLGGGDTTEVYKVKDIVGNRTLALKIPCEGATKEIGSQLNQEFFLLSRFNHPNIILPVDFGLAQDKNPFFTMEYFPGVPINKFFKGYSEELLLVLIKILHALEAIHYQGLIHCDVKPQNILVNQINEKDKEFNVKLLDFGFADSLATTTQTPRGTLGYIAPEIFKGTGADGRADLYSLGMVVYEVLTGIGPGTEKDLRSWLKTQYYSNFSPPRDIDHSIPEGFSNLVMRLIQRDAFRRPLSAIEVIESIGRLVELPTSVLVGGSKKDGESLFLSASSFVGRENQLTILKSKFEKARDSKGQLVFLTGERGVGKSRLLQEFKFIANLEGATILQFTQASLGARPPSLIEDLLANLSIYSTEKPEALLSTISGNSETEDNKFRTFETVVSRLKSLAKSPQIATCLLLLIDNFELFDLTSIEFLRYLGFSIENERIFIIIGSLNERRLLDLSKEFGQKDFFAHIALEALSETETEQLVEAVFGQSFVVPKEVELGPWLFSHTGGNPLFIIETLYSLVENKIIQLERGRLKFDKDKLKDYRSPDTVTEIIKRRLYNLAKEDIEILRIGATAGGPFNIEFLRAVLGYDERLMFSIIARLRALGLLRTTSISSEMNLDYGKTYYVLSSKTLEAIVTEAINVTERRENHRKVALAIELLYPKNQDNFLFDLAHHYAQAGMKDRAFTYCRQAGAKAKSLNLTEQALGFYENALSLSTNLANAREKIELIELVGELREITGRFNDAIDIYTQGMGILFSDKDLMKSDGLLPKLLRRLGLVSQKQGKIDDAINYFEQSLSCLKQSAGKELGLAISLWNDIGWALTTTNKFKEAERFLHQALQSIDKLKLEQLAKNRTESAQFTKESLMARTLYSLGVLAWYQGETSLASDMANRSLEIYQKLNEETYVSKVSQFLATIYWQRRDLTRAKDYYNQVLPMQREKGDAYFRIRTLQGLGLVSYDIGEWHKSLEYLDEAKGLCQKIGDQEGLGDILCNLGIVLEEIDEWPRAVENYKKDIEIRQNIKNDKGLGITLNNLAGLLIKKGEFQDAEALLREALAIGERLKDNEIMSEAYLGKTKLELMKEKFDDAVKNLSASLLQRRENRNKSASGGLLESIIIGAELRARQRQWHKTLINTERAQRLMNNAMNPKLTAITLRWQGLAKTSLGFTDQGKDDLNKSIEILRTLGAKYEMAQTLLAKSQALYQITTLAEEAITDNAGPVTYKPLTQHEFTQVSDDLREATGIFTTLGAKPNEERVKDMLNHLTQLETTRQLKGRERGEYLKVFYELSELINLNLEKEDFADKLLDLIIDVTQAERGLLFLMQGDKLYPAAARNVDHTTLEDAQTISKTVIRQVKKRAEPIICADALTDSRFVSSNSVMLNKIRSLVCVPLRVEDKVIGTIYLDSRMNPNVFVDDDKNLLISVANLLAATIDRSFAFKKMQDDFSALREDILTDAVTGYFLGRSKAIKDVYQIIEQIATTDCTVLLLGETGSGKGVLARLVHANSNRRANKFVSINCGTLPETLFESELFGHAKGAFTGAIRDKEGLFEIAENGTIFMDEIANTTLSVQAKLLEVLEDKIIRRVGETEPRRVDVRLICATNKNLDIEVKENRFREDLIYRLNVVTIQVPPLRDRKSDIMLLAGYFLKRYAKQLNKPILGFDDNIPPILVDYPWPGNVRELQNVIERAVIMAQKRKISLENLGAKFETVAKTIKVEKGPKKSLEKDEVIEAMKASQGNVSRAAQILSTHRRQLQRLLRRYGIDKGDFQPKL
jgi:Nif-specific regulatory protein